MKKKINVKLILNILMIFFLIGIFGYFLFSEDGLVDLFKNHRKFSWGWLGTAVICHMINLVADVYLIFKFVKNGFGKYKLAQAIRASMVGQFFSAVTPGSSGGQPMQIYVMSKQGVDSGLATSALLQKFLVYQMVLTIYCGVAILFRIDYFNSLNKVVWSIALFGFFSQAVAIGAMLLFSFCPTVTKKIVIIIFAFLGKLPFIKDTQKKLEKIEAQIEIFHKSNKEFYKNKLLVLESYVVSVIHLSAIFLVPYCIYRSFYLSGQSVFSVISAQAFVTMSTSFVPIPGASGAAEGASSIFFDPFFGPTIIKPAVLISRIISYYFTVLISAPFSYIPRKKKQEKLDINLSEN